MKSTKGQRQWVPSDNHSPKIWIHMDSNMDSCWKFRSMSKTSNQFQRRNISRNTRPEFSTTKRCSSVHDRNSMTQCLGLTKKTTACRMPRPRKISDWFVFNLFGYKFDLKTFGELVSWVLSLGFDWNYIEYIEVFIPCSKQRFDWFWKWWAMLSIATTYAFLNISWLTHSDLIHGITKRVAIMGSTRPSRSHRQCECFFSTEKHAAQVGGLLVKISGTIWYSKFDQHWLFWICCLGPGSRILCWKGWIPMIMASMTYTLWKIHM